MGFLDSFKQTPSISPDEVREYINNKRTDEYYLIDVRQPMEYEKGHLPGARLIPLSELPNRLKEITPRKNTIVYCRSGNRSLSAANILMGAGFKNIFNMEGGIVRYNGIVANGMPEAGMFCFPETLSPGQLSAVAWYLEDSTIRFLENIRDNVFPGETSVILKELIDAKHAHKDTLVRLYTDLTGHAPAEDFPKSVLDVPAEEIMVGCVKVSAALDWVKGKTFKDVLEIMISLGANAYDLYLKLGRAVKSDEARKVFTVLSEEERQNIKRIASAYEKTL